MTSYKLNVPFHNCCVALNREVFPNLDSMCACPDEVLILPAQPKQRSFIINLNYRQ